MSLCDVCKAMKQEQMKEALKLALEALEEIALAGMSGTGQESKEGMTEWHARQAWKFISIAARALGPIRDVLAKQSPQRSEDTKERSDWNEQENLYDLAVKADNGGQP